VWKKWLSAYDTKLYVISSAKLHTSKFTTVSCGFPATARLSYFTNDTMLGKLAVVQRVWWHLRIHSNIN